ncbi:Transferase domain-containing protein [Cephalotus follicularis]|uniref:Transferase domain-containing protein n=1 Tax=Cephalotus follicularis TaxID=3775 RepID=A0A1Q3AWM3_CEPFO|nr:Transferase domain-containing protein [Cephalotus follicularis]
MARQQENHPSVCITKTLSVLPKILHPQKILSLSNLDRQCPLLMYLVFFYKPSFHENLPLNSVFKSLKSGLEETLSIWYPAAGRLSLTPNDGKLNLWCNNSGAILVEAVSHVKISELGDLSHYNEFFDNLVYKPVFNGNFSDMPLVVAQVTRFGCGGYSIGIGTSHSLFDGQATYEFMSAWASNSAIMKLKGGHETVKPVHERGRLLVGNFQIQNGITKLPTNSNLATRATAINHLYLLIKQAMIDQNNGADGQLGVRKVSDMGNSLSYVFKSFHLSGAVIESLKRQITGGISSSCSSFEVVAAHLWKARIKALGLMKESMVCLQFSVDTRYKMVPPLPKGFSGNAYVLASIALTAGQLEEESHEAIVEKIKEAKTSVSSDYVNAYIEALDGPQANLPPLKELTIVSDWTRMPFHKIEFLNKEAAYASPLVPPIPQVAYFMQNPSDFRGIDVRIGLLPQTLDAFTQYFLNNAQ